MTATADADYAAAVAQCRDCDLSVDWWTRGGAPGPSWTSDKLTVVSHAGLTRATYIRARFDPAYDKNFRAVEYQAAVNRSEAESLVRALDGDGLFARRLAAEERGDLADGIKDTITVELDRRRFDKTVIAVEPDQLAQAAAARNRLVQIVMAAAKGRDLNARRP